MMRLTPGRFMLVCVLGGIVVALFLIMAYDFFQPE